jgi:tetratricopeptide (TPR) repeat protein
MADTDQERKEQVPFDQHALYAKALEHLQEGDEARAVDTLEKLVKLYPREQAIRDLLLRLQLRGVLPAAQEVRIPRPPGPSWVRIVVMTLLGLTALLVVVVGFSFAYQTIVVPAAAEQQEQRQLEALRLACQQRLERGDLPGAREKCAEWAEVVGNSPEVDEILASIEEQQVLSDLYADAVEAQYRGDCETALPLLNEVESLSPGYRNVRQLIDDCRKRQALDAAWQEVEALQEGGDWDALISALLTIRSQSPDYKRAQVEELLYQSYSGLGRERLDGARGDLEDLGQAIGYLQEALRLRPSDYALAEELRLARRYVAGVEAYQREAWEDAVGYWEPIYLAQPGYQSGILAGQIEDAYPRAGKQLIAEAEGNAEQIRRGIFYLERALSFDPDNADWLQERLMAQEYLAGLEAYQEESWDAAIRQWGPVYGARPDYQGGRLAELLGTACANSDEPDPGVCPP